MPLKTQVLSDNNAGSALQAGQRALTYQSGAAYKPKLMGASRESIECGAHIATSTKSAHIAPPGVLISLRRSK